ncbi:hypothetical protein CsSME_00004496 [Camellia sinensis var. sinensis]
MVTALTNAYNLIMSYFAWEDSEQARSSTNLEQNTSIAWQTKLLLDLPFCRHAFELYSGQHKFLQGDIQLT